MDANEQRSCKKPFNHELGAQGGGGGGGIWEKIDGGFGRDIMAMSKAATRNLKKRSLKFRLQGPPKPNQQCAPTKFSIGLASLILRETCGTIRCTEQHFYTMMLSHNRFLRLMAMHSILKKNGVHFSIPLVSQVVKMYLKDLYTNFYPVTTSGNVFNMCTL